MSDSERMTTAKAASEKAERIAVQQATEMGRNTVQPPNADCRNSKENGTLRVGATCRSGDDRIRTCSQFSEILGVVNQTVQIPVHSPKTL